MAAFLWDSLMNQMDNHVKGIDPQNVIFSRDQAVIIETRYLVQMLRNELITKWEYEDIQVFTLIEQITSRMMADCERILYDIQMFPDLTRMPGDTYKIDSRNYCMENMLAFYDTLKAFVGGLWIAYSENGLFIQENGRWKIPYYLIRLLPSGDMVLCKFNY